MAFYLSSAQNNTTLHGLYSVHSIPAQIIRTREAASIRIPETPRPLTPPPQTEAEDNSESEEESLEEQHEDLFNDLSNALAAEDGDRELARRAALQDPTLSKSGPVNVKVVVRCRPLLRAEIKKQIPMYAQPNPHPPPALTLSSLVGRRDARGRT